MGGGLTLGHGLEQMLQARGRRAAWPTTRSSLDEVGGLVATAHALSCLGFRMTLAALAGADPSGSEAAVRKLLGVLHDQRVQEVGMHLGGADGAVAAGDGRAAGAAASCSTATSRSPAARARSSATSSASVCSACRRDP